MWKSFFFFWGGGIFVKLKLLSTKYISSLAHLYTDLSMSRNDGPSSHENKS